VVPDAGHSLGSQLDIYSQNPSLHSTLYHPCAEFIAHSFRIGAAIAAARAGVEDLVICTLGGWNGSAFHVYVSQDQLA